MDFVLLFLYLNSLLEKAMAGRHCELACCRAWPQYPHHGNALITFEVSYLVLHGKASPTISGATFT